MQITAIKNAPRALKMLPVVAAMAISSITAAKADEQNNEFMSKAASDSITAVTKGTVAANNNDTITFEDAINDSIANALTEKRDTVLNYEKRFQIN